MIGHFHLNLDNGTCKYLWPRPLPFVGELNVTKERLDQAVKEIAKGKPATFVTTQLDNLRIDVLPIKDIPELVATMEAFVSDLKELQKLAEEHKK